MVNVMDYTCPVCGGKDPDCQECEGTGIVRMLCGTIPEDFDDDDDFIGIFNPLEPKSHYRDAFLKWYLETRGSLPHDLDPVAEGIERAFLAGWTAREEMP